MYIKNECLLLFYDRYIIVVQKTLSSRLSSKRFSKYIDSLIIRFTVDISDKVCQ